MSTVDITSVDLRSPQAEEESRARVKLIVDSFEKLRGFLGGPSNPRDDVSPLSSPSPADRILSRDRERGMWLITSFYHPTEIYHSNGPFFVVCTPLDKPWICEHHSNSSNDKCTVDTSIHPLLLNSFVSP